MLICICVLQYFARIFVNILTFINIFFSLRTCLKSGLHLPFRYKNISINLRSIFDCSPLMLSNFVSECKMSVQGQTTIYPSVSSVPTSSVVTNSAPSPAQPHITSESQVLDKNRWFTIIFSCSKILLFVSRFITRGYITREIITTILIVTVYF